MLYDFALIIAASTTEASPTEQELKLTYGVIHRVEIEFPPGCAGLAHIALDYGKHQVWPTNPERSFASDNHVIAWNDHLPLSYAPFTLKLRGWNEDDTYPHTITVRIGILPPEALGARMQRPGVLEGLRAAFGLTEGG